MMKKRIVSLLMALVMAVSLLPTSAFAVETADTTTKNGSSVTVTFSAQANGAFLFNQKEVEVKDGLAEEYGFAPAKKDHNGVAVSDPTVLDLLVAVHKQIYGDKFTKATAKNYLKYSGGMLSRTFGIDSYNVSFFVNGTMPNDGIVGTYGTTGYVADTARLVNDDRVEFWFYQGAYWDDYYTYFVAEDTSVAVTKLTKTANESVSLSLAGFMAVSAMGYEPKASVLGSGAYTVNLVNENGSIGAPLATTTSGEGIELTFAHKGAYFVTASGTVSSDSGKSPIISPWCEITVSDGDEHSYTNENTDSAYLISEDCTLKTYYKSCDCGATSSATFTRAGEGHNYGEWTVTKWPTLTAEGEKERECTKCGEKETLAIEKAKSVTVNFHVTPADAVLRVQDAAGDVLTPTDGKVTYSLLTGNKYTWSAVKVGYVAATGELSPKAGTDTVTVNLSAAPANTHVSVNAQWNNFRNSDVNMAITDAQTPKSAATTELKWVNKLGSGWSAAPSVSVIVDDALVVMSGKTLYKLSLEDGTVKQSATMAASPSYGYTPPTYAAGMIFCPLGSGTVQAFDAKTLESVWIYKDALKGQALTPITYSDGYIYTGFWNSEVKEANYVCLSVTDENTAETDESKVPAWTKAVTGGFYWAGSVVVGDYVIFGTDDGERGSTGTSHLYALNKETGTEVSSIDLTNMGDQRSTIAYDNGRVYFTTKGGYLCSAAFNSATGMLSDLKYKNMGAQSTSTPVVYDGYVYVCAGSGVVDEGAGVKGAGHFIVAKADTLEKVSVVAMKGYPQCSALLSTAYKDEGYLYFYCTYNTTPGGISLVKVNTKTHQATLEELYDAKGYEQYCITSVICDENGDLYYKNDSGNVLALTMDRCAEFGHNLTAMAAKAATCTEAGHSAYWFCSRCGKFFSDAAGKTEIAKDSWVIAALGHKLATRAAVAATCYASGHEADTYCKRCGMVITAGANISATGKHTYVNGVCTVCGVKNPTANVKGDDIKVDSKDDKTVSGGGLVIKAKVTVDNEKLIEIKAAVESGSIAVKVDNEKAVQTTDEQKKADGGKSALESKANDGNTSAEVKKELTKLIDKLADMRKDNSGKKDAQIEKVVDVAVELVKTVNEQVTSVAQLIELPQSVTVTISITDEMYNSLLNRKVCVVRSHTDASGNVTTTELPAYLGGTEGNRVLSFQTDKASTFAIVSYETTYTGGGSTGNGGSGSGSITVVKATSANTADDSQMVIWLGSAVMAAAAAVVLTRKQKRVSK